MTDRQHLYLLISDVPPGWSREDRDIAYAALGTKGRQAHHNPARLTHSRKSLNGSKIIVEGDFSADELTRESVVATMAQALQVNPVAVNAKVAYQVLGGAGASYEQSHAAALAYLADHAAEWEAPST